MTEVPTPVVEVNYLIYNNCYLSGKPMKPKGIVVHSVGCNQPSREVFVKSWNVPRPNGRQICPHAFVDNKGITQTLPLGIKCWGCGSGKHGSFNNNRIQFEMCEPRGMKYSSKTGALESYNPEAPENAEYFKKCYSNAVYYCAYICLMLGLPVSSIVSHKEAAALGYASNHGDPEHWFKYHGKDMDDLRREVKELLDKWKTDPPALPEKEGDTKEELNEKTPFLIHIRTKGVHIRKGPATNYKIIQDIKPGGYTIVKVENGFGFLKSGVGWINLKNLKKTEVKR